MADNPQPPIPPGVPGAPVTPMKKSTGKVQPKKETVRITLPPKPSAAPTIKLPTLPPTGAPGGMPGATPAAPKPAAGTAAPVAAPRTTTAAPVSATAAAAAAQPATRPAPAGARVAIAPVVVAAASPLDTALAIGALVSGAAAIGTTIWMMVMLNYAIAN